MMAKTDEAKKRMFGERWIDGSKGGMIWSRGKYDLDRSKDRGTNVLETNVSKSQELGL